MSQAEYYRWVEHYKQFPFDDMHRYHRPAALVATSMSGAKVETLLVWLAPSYNDSVEESDYSQADLATFKALGLDNPPKRK